MWTTEELYNSSGAEISETESCSNKRVHSPDMFAETPLAPSEEELNIQDESNPGTSEENNLQTEDLSDITSWRGIPLKDFQNYSSTEFPPVMNTRNHTVLFELPLGPGVPKPHRGKDKWDRDHVKMPFSAQSLYPVNENGANILQSRWDLIQTALLRSIKTSQELEDAILIYNAKYKGKWSFRQLHRLFNEVLEEEEADYFFDNTLPAIIQLALQLPDLVPSALPLLRQNKQQSVSLSQHQIASLMANAFLCTFPHRNTQRTQSEYIAFPDINFNKFYQSGQKDNHITEKLKCICHYFRRVCNKVPTGVVTFTRKHMQTSALPRWNTCDDNLGETKLHVCSETTIEEGGINMLQVDFANKFIGGGVLGWGCVQEEIRFTICPELIISRLFTEVMKPNEAIVINGVEQYSKYSGYGHTFVWAGDFEDNTPRDSSRRIKCSILAIDALHFVQPQHQYMRELMRRELNKAYVGFHSNIDCRLMPIATGNWGCGAYKGDPCLKFLLQLIACRYARRDMVYFTFDDAKLRNKIFTMYNFIKDNNITIAQLWKYLCDFQKSEMPGHRLYMYLMQSHTEASSSQVQRVSTLPDRSNEQNRNYPFTFQKSLFNPSTSTSLLPSTSTQKPLWYNSHNSTTLLTDADIEEFLINDSSTTLENNNQNKVEDNTNSTFQKENAKSSLVDRLGEFEIKNTDIIISDSSQEIEILKCMEHEPKSERKVEKVENTVTVTFVNERKPPLKFTSREEQSGKNSLNTTDSSKNINNVKRSQKKISDFYSLFSKK